MNVLRLTLPHYEKNTIYIYGKESSYTKDKREKELALLGNELNLKNVALTFVPSFSDKESNVFLNKINPSVENTFIIYRHRSIIDKYVDLKPTEGSLALLSSILDKTKSPFFDLAEPRHE